MRFDELVDVTIYHPFRYHREVVVTHCNSQQGKHVWMAQRLPRHNFLAEPLNRSGLTVQRTLLARRRELTLVILPKSLVV